VAKCDVGAALETGWKTGDLFALCNFYGNQGTLVCKCLIYCICPGGG
jgi:hypothetical protein